MEFSYIILKTQMGYLYIEATKENITKVNWTNKEKNSTTKSSNSILMEAKKQINFYIKGKKINFDLPLNPYGTKFQKKTWNYIKKIKWGKQKSYKNISKKVFKKKVLMGPRAIGNVCSSNPILILIPCHRVIYSNGGIGGYNNKISRKKKLLILEKNLIF
jgi:methylated-DNA-[protein]-cysteine S-methyltransferase